MTPWEQEHNKRVESYANRIRLIYREAAAKAGKLASLPGYDPAKPFNIENYPHAKARIDKILKEVYTQTKYTITEGIDKEWYESNRKLDAQVKAKSPIPPPSWMQHNEEAREAFKIRQDAGMDLSKRVWNLTEQFKQELELAIDVGLTDGRSAAELSRDVRKYLNEPDRLFRRVRNKNTGKLQLSKAAKAYHPGRGVYRSSYKNAMRLTRTETNMAYRGADHLRYQQLDFVLGFEVHLSNNHPVYDICDELKGKYPKGFKFVGWHPHCRCYVTTLLMDEKEFNAVEDRLLAGDDISDYVSPNSHMTVPTGMTKWVKANKDRVGNYAKMPYFIRDNFVGGHISGGVDFKRILLPPTQVEITMPVKAAEPARVRRVKTAAQRQQIQTNWNRRANKRLYSEEILMSEFYVLDIHGAAYSAVLDKGMKLVRKAYDTGVNPIMMRDMMVELRKQIATKKAWDKRADIVKMNDILDNAQGAVRIMGLEKTKQAYQIAKMQLDAAGKYSPLVEQNRLIKLIDSLEPFIEPQMGINRAIQIAYKRRVLELEALVKPAATTKLKYKPMSMLQTDNMLRRLTNNPKVTITGNIGELNRGYHKIMDGFDLEEFIASTEATFAKYNLQMGNVLITGDDAHVFIGVLSKAGEFHLERKFTFEGYSRVAEHSYFSLWKSLQGQGISKEMFGHLHKQYIQSDIRFVKVHANINVGGYTWGRYGFCMRSKYTAENFIDSITSHDVTMNIACMKKLDAFYKKNAPDKPFPMNLIADIKGMKKLLLDTDWYGTLDLKNKVQRQRFEDYLYGRI